MGTHLIVGLGNPGAEYEGARHNIGFRVVDALARHLGEKEVCFEHDRDALIGWTRYRGGELGLAKPLTYVNRSGETLQRLLRAHDLDLGELLVVVDDLHLPVGRVRLRGGGSSGGHNGLANITRRLGTDQYPRLRLGIGSDFPGGEMVDFVLSPFTSEEQPLIAKAVEQACKAALTFTAEGLETAMNRFN